MPKLLFPIAFIVFLNCGNEGNTSASQNKDISSSSIIKDSSQINKGIIETVQFPSLDSLVVTADMYLIDKVAPLAILCHQAGYSRGEYKETALTLNKLGYNCIAIDQRSGDKINGVINQTALRAKEKGYETSYMDARQDIIAVIDYMYKAGHKDILLVGSSYSASLALLIGTYKEEVKAIAAFSPGEYLKGIELGKDISVLKKPLFVTSSKTEAAEVKHLVFGIDSTYITHFIPEAEGDHGSKVLWSKNSYSEEYWNSFKTFLKKLN